MSGEDRLNLRPHVSAEPFGLHRAKDDRDIENPGRLAKDLVAVDDGLAVEVSDPEEHLRLKVNDGDNAVVRGQQPLLAAFG